LVSFAHTHRVEVAETSIDGVAPRAKMNQQRSRRFRSAQEAKEKDEARQESLLLWKGKKNISLGVTYCLTSLAMGKEISEAEQQKASWDSNAITPGTPFMDLLASSLRYWVVQKMNTDPGWKNVCNFRSNELKSHLVTDSSSHIRRYSTRRRRA